MAFLFRKYFPLFPVFLLAPAAPAQTTAPGITSIVSAASYQPVVAPEAFATIFGTGLTTTPAQGNLDSSGNYPANLAGVSVRVGGQPAGVQYVSPTQINFVVPATAQPGNTPVTISSPA